MNMWAKGMPHNKSKAIEQFAKENGLRTTIIECPPPEEWKTIIKGLDESQTTQKTNEKN